MRVELHCFKGCPHSTAARALLERCIGELGLMVPVLELQGAHPSPSILIDGEDVMGNSPTPHRACRLDVPTEKQLLAALIAASRRHDADL